MSNMTDGIERKTFVGNNSASQYLFYSFTTITTIILLLLLLILLLLLSHTCVYVRAEPRNFPRHVASSLTMDSLLRPLSSISTVGFFRSHAQSSDSDHYSPGKYRHMFTHSAMLHLSD